MSESNKYIRREARGEQLDVFYESNPELKEKAQRANFRVSILGGDAAEEPARRIAYMLTHEFYSVQTGGYNTGAMKGGLEGANQALREMNNDEKTKTILGQVYPFPKGITAERFAPDWTPKGFSSPRNNWHVQAGEHIKIEVAEGDLDVYKRLGSLMERSSAIIVLPGSRGTELEVMANLNFDKKLKSQFNIASKPIIFVGNEHNNLAEASFREVINESDDVYQVQTEEEAVELIKILQELKDSSDPTDKEIKELDDKRKNYLLRFEDKK